MSSHDEGQFPFAKSLHISVMIDRFVYDTLLRATLGQWPDADDSECRLLAMSMIVLQDHAIDWPHHRATSASVVASRGLHAQGASMWSAHLLQDTL